MRIIALEEHFLSPELSSRLGSGALPPELIARLADVGTDRIADMDAAGIDVQILGHTSPGMQAITRDAADVARRVNDFTADAVQGHPDRLRAFAVLPTTVPDAAAEELGRAKGELGMVGSMINGTTDGRFLDHPSFDPLLAASAELAMPLYLHPGPPPPAVREAYFSDLPTGLANVLSTAGWGWHAETATHVLRMILTGVFDRHPRLQLIIGHMGETLPFFLARIEQVFARFSGQHQRPITDYFQTNILITTAGVSTIPPLMCALEVLGASRILFSVDYPYASSAEATRFLRDAEIDLGHKESIAHGNAEGLFGDALRPKEPRILSSVDPDPLRIEVMDSMLVRMSGYLPRAEGE